MSIVPSRLHRVKLFEVKDYFVRDGDGRRRIDSLCSVTTIEQDIDAWVDRTRNLIVGTGPLSVTQSADAYSHHSLLTAQFVFPEELRGLDPVPIIIETRTLSVIYVPAVEQLNGRVYGEQQPASQQGTPEQGSKVGEVRNQPEPGGAGRPAGEGKGRLGGRGPLRVPPV